MTETRGIYHYTAVVTMITALFLIAIIENAYATPSPDAQAHCKGTDTACLLPRLEGFTADIQNTSWRDQILRETAKLYAARNNLAAALDILPKITTPDTRALTIRGIGMEAAKLDLPLTQKQDIFSALRVEADKIDHKPSYAIALTYIAMAQAFAGDDQGAYATASSMDNTALRHKAFAEAAEIQAERGDGKAALHSLSAIDDHGFLNKSYGIVARIFADRGDYEDAVAMAEKIDNPYLKSRSLLYILAKQITPHDTAPGIKE